MARPDNFLSNFEPLTAGQVQAMVERVTEFDQFTPPMRELLAGAAAAGAGYVVCSANPRLVNGKPSKNPRYLQIRPDLLDPDEPVRRRARHAFGAGDPRRDPPV